MEAVIDCKEGGSIRGRVANVPADWMGNYWVVAFSRNGIRMETRVGDNNQFLFSQLPSGEYGLKVGHDAYHDAEVSAGDLSKLPQEAFDVINDPWQRAKIVTVQAGIAINGVELELPPGEEKTL
jgi:hypothetical protein